MGAATRDDPELSGSTRLGEPEGGFRLLQGFPHLETVDINGPFVMSFVES